MPREEIQRERIEETRFRFDEAVIGGRGNGEFRVGEYAEQLDGLFSRNTVAVADEDEHRVGYRGKVLERVAKGCKPERCDLLHVCFPVLWTVDVPVRLAQVGDQVGLLPLQSFGIHL